MDMMIDYLLLAGTTALSLLAHLIYLKEMFGFKRPAWLYPLFHLGYEVVYAEFIFNPENVAWNVCCNWAYMLFLAWFFCKGSWKKKMILVSVFIMVALFFEPFLTIVIVELGICAQEEIYGNNKILAAIYFIEWFSMIGITQIISILFKDRLRKATGNRHGLGILFISISSIVVSFIQCMNMMKQEAYIWENVVVLILLLLVSLMCYYFFLVGEDKNRLEMEYKVYEEQVKLYSQWIEEQKQTQNTMAAFRHDMKNHITALKGICSKNLFNGQVNGLQEVNRYLDSIGTNYDIRTTVVNSGSVLIDAILNMKINYALSLGFKVTTEVTVPKDWNYDGLDMVIVLGNLLDNAIEADEKAAEEEKKLHITVRYDKGNLFVVTENSYSGEYDGTSGTLSEDKLPKTTKKDKLLHGIGMRNIAGVVDKYKGEMRWRAEQKVFYTEVLLYGVEGKLQS